MQINDVRGLSAEYWAGFFRGWFAREQSLATQLPSDNRHHFCGCDWEAGYNAARQLRYSVKQ